MGLTRPLWMSNVVYEACATLPLAGQPKGKAYIVMGFDIPPAIGVCAAYYGCPTTNGVEVLVGGSGE
jgi:hypothetical protein